MEDQRNYRYYTFTLWPELRDEVEDIHIIKANPTLINKPPGLIAKEINYAVSEGKSKIIFYNPSEAILPLDVLKIHKALDKINIQPSQLYYLTATLNANEVYEKLCRENNLTQRINVVHLMAMFHNLQSINFHAEQPTYVIENKSKKFLCFNRSLRLHRIALIAKLIQKNLLDTGYISTYTEETEWIDYHRYGMLNVIDPTLRKTITENRDIFPLTIDQYDKARDNPISLTDNDKFFYNTSYYSLITETLFFKDPDIDKLTSDYPYAHDSVTFTEKTFKPIAMKHPFILMSTTNSLKGLRLLGYKTFSPYINEDYDSECDDVKRFNMIIEEIERLNSFTDDQWLEWLTNVQEIVEHNFNMFINTRNYRIKIDTPLLCSNKD